MEADNTNQPVPTVVNETEFAVPPVDPTVATPPPIVTPVSGGPKIPTALLILLIVVISLIVGTGVYFGFVKDKFSTPTAVKTPFPADITPVPLQTQVPVIVPTNTPVVTPTASASATPTATASATPKSTTAPLGY